LTVLIAPRDGSSGDAQQVADALDGGVAIGFRVFRQQLVLVQRAVRRAPTTSVKVPPRSIQKSQTPRS
jgi:hypothetical protein